MKNFDAKVARLEELKAMLSEYRQMTVEQVEASGWGDREIEIEAEVWRLEMELVDEGRRRSEAA